MKFASSSLVSAVLAFSLFLVIPIFITPDKSGAIVGKVSNASTKQPISGAYVLAIYKGTFGSWFGHSNTECVKTVGVITNARGEFRFEKIKGTSAALHALVPDFTEKPSQTVLESQSEKSANTSVNIFMDPRGTVQDTRMTSVSCMRASSMADVEANIFYLKLLAAEERKYERAGLAELTERKIKYMGNANWSKGKK